MVASKAWSNRQTSPSTRSTKSLSDLYKWINHLQAIQWALVPQKLPMATTPTLPIQLKRPTTKGCSSNSKIMLGHSKCRSIKMANFRPKQVLSTAHNSLTFRIQVPLRISKYLDNNCLRVSKAGTISLSSNLRGAKMFQYIRMPRHLFIAICSKVRLDKIPTRCWRPHNKIASRS